MPEIMEFMDDFSPNQTLQATAVKRLGWQVGRQRSAVPELIRSPVHVFMGIEMTEVVDAVGIEKTTGEVVLTIADHLPWNISETQHLQMLQDKINAYLRFIESGEMRQAYPAAGVRRPVISLVGRCEPSAAALQFLTTARQTIESAGIGFRFEQYAGDSTNLG